MIEPQYPVAYKLVRAMRDGRSMQSMFPANGYTLRYELGEWTEGVEGTVGVFVFTSEERALEYGHAKSIQASWTYRLLRVHVRGVLLALQRSPVVARDIPRCGHLERKERVRRLNDLRDYDRATMPAPAGTFVCEAVRPFQLVREIAPIPVYAHDRQARSTTC